MNLESHGNRPNAQGEQEQLRQVPGTRRFGSNDGGNGSEGTQESSDQCLGKRESLAFRRTIRLGEPRQNLLNQPLRNLNL